MKVKDLKPILEKNKEILHDLQLLEKNLANSKDKDDQLDEHCGTSNILEAVRAARMSFYDNEVLRIERLIDEAEVQGSYKD